MKTNNNMKMFRYITLTCGFLFMFTRRVNAYLDPSVMTYAIQAISGIVIALGTFGGIAYRKLKNKFFKDNTSKIIETNDFYRKDNNGVTEYALDKESHIEELFDYSKYNEKNGPLTLKKRIIDLLPIDLMFSISLFFFSPIFILITNYGELKNSSFLFAPYVTIITIVMFLVFLLVGFIKEKSYYIISSIMFSLGVAFFIQTLINPEFPPMNGSEIIWGWYTKSTVISSIVWILIILVPLFFIIKELKITKTARRIISWLIVLTEVLSLVFTYYSTSEMRRYDKMIVSKEGEFDLSPNKNTVVFVVDTLDAYWAEAQILDEPEYQKLFKDFTYFSDVVSNGAPTVLGMPAMYTGQYFNPRKESVEDYYRRAYQESGIFEIINRNGWGQKHFTGMTYLKDCDISLIDNVIKGEYKIGSLKDGLKEVYKLGFFNSSPMPFKRYFWNTQNLLQNHLVPKDNWEEFSTEDDPTFYQDMLNNPMTTNYDKNLFVLYHMFGAHGPFYMDENAKRIPVETDDDYRLNQIKGCLKIIETFINEMKDNNIYDSSTIIITADHGGLGLYQNPTVLIKKPNTTQDKYVTNDKPLDFTNLYATYIKSVSEDEEVEYEDLFESDGYEVRYHTASNTLAELKFPANRPPEGYTQFTITGKARDGLADIKEIKE